jgi:hypothetical protein
MFSEMISDFEEKYILSVDDCELLFQALFDKPLANILRRDGQLYMQQVLQARSYQRLRLVKRMNKDAIKL